jgi:ABC-type nitrate/sulfonate/bicarbonate transport system ATPase subunit
MITGQQQPDSGTVDIGPTVKMAYVDQSRDCLDGSKTVFEELAQGRDILQIGKFEMPSRAYIGRFNFKGADQGKQVGNLSGGERGRLHLAKTLMTGGNVLLLDEPSNDLDVETLRALEDALLEFPGCAMVISHDRWFLDRICTTSWRPKAIRSGTSLKAISRNTKMTRKSAWVKKAPSRSEFATSRLPAKNRWPKFRFWPFFQVDRGRHIKPKRPCKTGAVRRRFFFFPANAEGRNLKFLVLQVSRENRL